jgi:DNA-binding LacI/PurR family transcriptional regulator
MGDAAVRLLLARIDGSATGQAQTEVMAPTLMIRDSCAAPAASSRKRAA